MLKTAITAVLATTSILHPGNERLYSPASPWNQQIRSDRVHPDSDRFLDRIAAKHSDGLTSDPNQFTYPVFLIESNEQLQRIRVHGNVTLVDNCNNSQRSPFGFFNGTSTGRPWLGMTRPNPGLLIPVPNSASSLPDSDASIIIISPTHELGMWRFGHDGPRTASSAYYYPHTQSGVPNVDQSNNNTYFLARGAGVPYHCGLVRRHEIDAGRIEHAIAFATPTPANQFVYPATRSDGQGKLSSFDIPQGARLRLKQSVPLPSDPAARAIHRALQRYGMICIDSSGRSKIIVEANSTAHWNGMITADTTAYLSWSDFELLDFPHQPITPGS